jgi:hypothetical protein
MSSVTCPVAEASRPQLAPVAFVAGRSIPEKARSTPGVRAERVFPEMKHAPQTTTAVAPSDAQPGTTPRAMAAAVRLIASTRTTRLPPRWDFRTTTAAQRTKRIFPHTAAVIRGAGGFPISRRRRTRPGRVDGGRVTQSECRDITLAAARDRVRPAFLAGPVSDYP